jgi:hypothetical protein
MVKQHSWTRTDYEDAYRLMRSSYGYDWLLTKYHFSEEVLRAADYSYQASDYLDGGWISNKRRERFYAIKCRILTQREVYPF